MKLIYRYAHERETHTVEVDSVQVQFGDHLFFHSADQPMGHIFLPMTVRVSVAESG